VWLTPLPALILALGACDPIESTRSRYYWGAEVNVVCPCVTVPENQCYWVRAEPALLNPLTSFTQRNAARPYQPMYLEYRGTLSSEPAVGFGANYDGLMVLHEVVTVSAEIPSDCAEP
jgi:hypothetical protein